MLPPPPPCWASYGLLSCAMPPRAMPPRAIPLALVPLPSPQVYACQLDKMSLDLDAADPAQVGGCLWLAADGWWFGLVCVPLVPSAG